ncbi:MAG: alpha/beta hydrolase [Lachnospiraceae bacterium]|nr:alpha/beta hydrolase [Lachnospiraceae bacterium]
MNDTVREYLSYPKFIVPLLKVKKTVKADEVVWGGKDQYFMFFPAAGDKKDKLIIYIHGGGWNSHSPKQDFYIGQNLAMHGYDCFMPEYRKTPKYTYEDIADDVFKDYAEIRKYIKEKGLSYDKTILMGSSAGAHLAAVLCFDGARQERFSISKDEFNGLLLMAGPLCFDYEKTGTEKTLLKYLFGSKEVSDWKKGEPYSMLSARDDFKLKMIHSKHDGLLGWDQAQAFCDKASILGMETELYEVKEAWNTHSAYCSGVFLKTREESDTLNKTYEMLEEM